MVNSVILGQIVDDIKKRGVKIFEELLQLVTFSLGQSIEDVLSVSIHVLHGRSRSRGFDISSRVRKVFLEHWDPPIRMGAWVTPKNTSCLHMG